MLKSKNTAEDQELDIEAIVVDLEKRLDRLKVLYEQFFMGIEKRQPLTLLKDVVRIIHQLDQEQIRNTGVRYRFRTIVQRYNTFRTYWNRTLREMDAGTYKRDVARMSRSFARKGINIQATGRVLSVAEVEKAVAEAVRHQGEEHEPLGKDTLETAPLANQEFPDEDTLVKDTPAKKGAPAKGAPAKGAPAKGAPANKGAPAKNVQARPEKEDDFDLINIDRDNDDDIDMALDMLETPPTGVGQKRSPLAASKPSATTVAMGKEFAKTLEKKAEGAPERASSMQSSTPAISKKPGAAPAPSGKPAAAPAAAGKPAAAPAAAGKPAAAPAPAASGKPAPAPAASGKPAAAPAAPGKLPQGFSEDHMRALYQNFVKAKQMCGEDTTKVQYDSVVRSLSKQIDSLPEERRRDLDFQVVIRDGKAIFKAKNKP